MSASSRICLGYDGHDCDVSLDGEYHAKKRCAPCQKVNKHNYDVAFQRRRGSVRVSNQDNQTRLSLYRKWYDSASYFGNASAAKRWKAKADKIAKELGYA